jgi:putative Holliday junction resolvase
MTKIANNNQSIVALDVGERRIGVAKANVVARLAQPLVTIANDEAVITTLQKVITENDVTQLVVGRPRNQQGETTAQTRAVEAFVEQLKKQIEIPISWQDESLTSVNAEAELAQRGQGGDKAAVDALAATYILEDYLTELAA